VPRDCGVNCRQLPSFPEDPCLTEFSGRGTLETEPADEEAFPGRDISAPPRGALDESENRRHPPLSEAGDLPTSFRTASLRVVEFAGMDNVPRAVGWFRTPGWFCAPAWFCPVWFCAPWFCAPWFCPAPELKRRQPSFPTDRFSAGWFEPPRTSLFAPIRTPGFGLGTDPRAASAATPPREFWPVMPEFPAPRLRSPLMGLK